MAFESRLLDQRDLKTGHLTANAIADAQGLTGSLPVRFQELSTFGSIPAIGVGRKANYVNEPIYERLAGWFGPSMGARTEFPWSNADLAFEYPVEWRQGIEPMIQSDF